MQKIYVTEEQKGKLMEKLHRDVEVGDLLLHISTTRWQHQHTSDRNRGEISLRRRTQ